VAASAKFQLVKEGIVFLSLFYFIFSLAQIVEVDCEYVGKQECNTSI
jgi:hypothetical protein